MQNIDDLKARLTDKPDDYLLGYMIGTLRFILSDEEYSSDDKVSETKLLIDIIEHYHLLNNDSPKSV